jgi:predicted N-acyltransferase
MTVRSRVLTSIRDIPSPQWDACAAGQTGHINPFVSHAFLSSLEDSGSATAQTGWAAQHIVVEDDEKVVGTAPCYLKSHSYGEYVFDHGWADAFHRAGGKYYPKLQVSVPFTPVSGPRLLSGSAEVRKALVQNLKSHCDPVNASSVHVTFASHQDESSLAGSDWLKREDIQFHWTNEGYSTFADFLASLSSSKRKAIRKERESFAKSGVTFEWHTGASLNEQHWDAFFDFYEDTGARKWGTPYLNRLFFSLIHDRMADQILLVLAKRNNSYIAGALNFIGNDTLYGRNWGCCENLPFLHFEVCYYQAIEFAIQHRLKTVEAGAQGEHKLSRGYLPVKTTSFHHLRHQGLARAVADYLEHERRAVAENATILNEHSPFRQTQGD